MGEYVYGIIARKEAPKNFDVKGIDNKELYTINYQDLAAIASESPVKEYEPNEENTKKHNEVILEILKNHTVLPVAFGMVFKKRGILTSTMRRVYSVLRKSLRVIDNKIELGVKAIFPSDEKEIKNLLKDKTIDEFKKECEHEFVEALSKATVKSSKGKLFSERLVINRSFLVDRDKINEFSEILGKLDDKYAALKINYTGPWPPYNFVDIRIMGRGR
ncbi:MAG: GvpL/GvpF family gas vesicle protein [Nanoarchaeota archaeon]|nr:GvpL/GvpF family gas vesicle protein [Nanoarchaeota archaeon]